MGYGATFGIFGGPWPPCPPLNPPMWTVDEKLCKVWFVICEYLARDCMFTLKFKLASYIPRWFTRPQTVTHPGTNRVWRSAITLIEANALPLSQTANE